MMRLTVSSSEVIAGLVELTVTSRNCNLVSFVPALASGVELMRKRLAFVSLFGAGLLLATTASADPYNPADRAIGGGLLGAGTGAVIGAIGGGGHGAGIGAAVGGGVGAIMGAATTPPRPYHRYYYHHVVHRPY
jgi:hypothetical protein